MARSPSKDAERGEAAGTKQKARRPVPWQEAIRLLAAGLTEAEVAELVGCQLRTLRAGIARFGGLEAVVARYRAQTVEDPAETQRRLVELVYAHLERQLRAGNLRVLLWIADRLKLVRPLDDVHFGFDATAVSSALAEEGEPYDDQ